jgi:hypothetical protein
MKCQTCGGDQFARLLAVVPRIVRIALAKTLRLNYSVGDGSGLELPMTICLDCGTVQGDWPMEERP